MALPGEPLWVTIHAVPKEPLEPATMGKAKTVARMHRSRRLRLRDPRSLLVGLELREQEEIQQPLEII